MGLYDQVREEALFYLNYCGVRNWESAVDLTEKEFLNYLEKQFEFASWRERSSIHSKVSKLSNACLLLKLKGVKSGGDA